MEFRRFDSNNAWSGLEGLPDEVRRCWVLRVGQGFGEEEIAVLMKIPIETVRHYLDQARHRLGRGTGGGGRNDGGGA